MANLDAMSVDEMAPIIAKALSEYWRVNNDAWQPPRAFMLEAKAIAVALKSPTP